MPIYDYDRLFKNLESKIRDSDIRYTNKNIIFDFKNRLFSEGPSKPRVHKYTREIFQLAKMTDCILTNMEKKDVVELVANIEQNDRWAPASKQGYKITLKKFYKVMELPEEHIAWVNTTLKKKHKKLPSNMLDEDDVMAMIETNTNPRNRALIAAFWDAGGRVGEIGNWEVGYISTFRYGLKAQASGKTGARQIPLIVSAPYITQWLAVHPDRDNPKAPMWPSAKGGQLTYPGIYKILRESATKAGIKKPFNPHHFRHSRATHLANYMTESQMDEYLGWVQGSNMPSIYVHLSGKNIDNAALRAAGVEVEDEDKVQHKMKPKKCPRCSQTVGASFNLCPYCGLALTIEQAMSEEESEMHFDGDFGQLIASTPGMADALMDMLKKLQSKKDE